MQRHVIVAKYLLELIQNLDEDGSGLIRTAFYPLVNEHFDLSQEGEVLVNFIDYHLHLLETEGLVICDQDEEEGAGQDMFLLTWAGHDFIEKKRD